MSNNYDYHICEGNLHEWSTVNGDQTTFILSPIISLLHHITVQKTQISREGDRFQVHMDVAKLSFFVRLFLGDDDFNQEGGDTNRKNDNGGQEEKRDYTL